MKMNWFLFIFPVMAPVLFSCNAIEKASAHGFKSGYYQFEPEKHKRQKVYADITDEQIDIYPLTAGKPDKQVIVSIPLNPSDGHMFSPVVFRKQSLDIDITSILFKYRPSVYGREPQMTADFNMALYAGWRYDRYKIICKKDPLGRVYTKNSNWGYDWGIFAGPGVTGISPFTTQNNRSDEYSGLIMQTGVAGFIESNVASFGIGAGLDYLLNSDRKVWIYHAKPWVGFIVGIALN